MFTSAYDEQTRVSRLPNQHRAGVPAGELQDPVRPRRYRVGHRGDRLPVGVLEFLTAQILDLEWRGRTGGAEPTVSRYTRAAEPPAKRSPCPTRVRGWCTRPEASSLTDARTHLPTDGQVVRKGSGAWSAMVTSERSSLFPDLGGCSTALLAAEVNGRAIGLQHSGRSITMVDGQSSVKVRHSASRRGDDPRTTARTRPPP